MVDLTDPLVLHQAMLGRLYDQLTGDSDDFEQSGNFFTWMSVGMPIDPAEWDFMNGIIHPPIIETIVLEEEVEPDDEIDAGESATTTGMDRPERPETEYRQMEFSDADAMRFAIRSAAIFHHLVDNIPEVGGWIETTSEDSVFSQLGKGSDDTLHSTTLGRSVTREYERLLNECELAEVRQSEENERKIEALTQMLEKTVEFKDEDGQPMIDPMTNEPMQMTGDSRFMKAYNKHKQLAEDAELKLRGLRVDAMTSDDAAVVARANQELPILQARYAQARAMWEGVGMKNQVENWQAEIARLAPQTIASYWQRCVARLNSARLEDPQMGPYYFSSVQAPSILRNAGWTRFTLDTKNLENSYQSSQRRRSRGIGFPIPSTPVVIGLNSRRSLSSSSSQIEMTNLRIAFELAQTPIIRPHVNFNFLKNRRWRFAQGSAPLSDGGMPPEGAMPAISTHIVLIRDLSITFEELKRTSSAAYQAASRGGGLSVFGLNIGARIGGSNAGRRNNAEVDSTTGSITVDGTQIIGFRNQLIGKAPDPDPEVSRWIAPDIDVS